MLRLSLLALVFVFLITPSAPASGSDPGESVGFADTTFHRLTLHKTDSLPGYPQYWCVYPGDSVPFTISYDNVPNDYPVHNVLVIDVLPEQTDFVWASGGGYYVPAQRRVFWEVGTLEPGEGEEVQVILRVKDDASQYNDICNCVYIESDQTPWEHGVCSLTPVCDDVMYPLGLEKEADLPGGCFQTPGDMTYTITYFNMNYTTIHGVVVVDELPGEVEFVSASGGGIYTEVDHSVSWEIGTVAAHEGGDLHVSVRADSALLSWSTVTNICRGYCDEADERLISSYVNVCGAHGNPLVKATLHVEEHSSSRRCTSGLPALTRCRDIVTTVESGDVDVFPVFFNLEEYLCLEYGLMWPGEYSCAFTSCSDLTIGDIRYPGDGVAQAWQVCQPGPIGIGGWAWIFESGPAQICLVDHPQGYAINVRDCTPDGRLDEPEHTYCAGIAGAEGEDPCDYPVGVQPSTWGKIKSMFE